MKPQVPYCHRVWHQGAERLGDEGRELTEAAACPRSHGEYGPGQGYGEDPGFQVPPTHSRLPLIPSYLILFCARAVI